MSSSGINKLFEKPHPPAYFREMSLYDLVCYIQPLWNTYNMGYGKISKKKLKNLQTAMEMYQEKGGDLSFFTNGTGAPNKCNVL